MHEQSPFNPFAGSYTEVSRIANSESEGGNGQLPSLPPPHSTPEMDSVSSHAASHHAPAASSPAAPAVETRWWLAELIGLPSAVELRREKILQLARRRFDQKPDWVIFFREMLGSDGVVSTVFSSANGLAAFERSAEFQELQQMVAKLREQKPHREEQEPTRVITVRLPHSLHKSLMNEADRKNTSMNKLCISKLLQMIEEDFVPAEKATRKKRTAPAQR